MPVAPVLFAPLLTLALVPDGGIDDFVEPPLLEIGGPPPCSDDDDCPFESTPLCHPDLEQCTACITEEHCDEGWACHDNGYCFDACVRNEDCDGVSGRDICDPSDGSCVECITETDCDAMQHCLVGSCSDDLCEPGEFLCINSIIAECSKDGGTVTTVERCEFACEETPGGPVCTGPGESTGAVDTGASSNGDDSPPPNDDGPTATTMDPGSATSAATGNTSSDSDSAGSTLPRDSCACQSNADSGPASWAWLCFLLLVAAPRRLAGR